MLTEEKVQVLEVLERTSTILRLKTSGGSGKAILYRTLHSDVQSGDWIVVNTTATKLQLGTGGWDIVRNVIDKPLLDKKKEDEDGHIMKARYLGDQHSSLTIESPESRTHQMFHQKLDLQGRKVLLCELHSMLPIVWFILQSQEVNIPLLVVLSDEASLPLAMSKHLTYLQEMDKFESISTGQAFGAQKESINIVTALQYFHETHEEGIILITLGPGIVGSSTRYGFSSLSQGNWANMIGALGGTPIWIPRLSGADERERHQGISHHTITPLTELTLTKSILPLPSGDYSNKWIETSLLYLETIENVSIKKVAEQKLLPLLDQVQQLSPFPLTSMGRTIDKDPLFFLGVAAAVYWYLSEDTHSCNV
ncbi:DUF3866 family protein [Evansella sp. AB-rgal1]|uniref:DUF3866 family protein n=1 Tax=Evansella sp. AB-rgal1 TaxID=3242696 RepID=UPI00359CF1FB